MEQKFPTNYSYENKNRTFHNSSLGGEFLGEPNEMRFGPNSQMNGSGSSFWKQQQDKKIMWETLSKPSTMPKAVINDDRSAGSPPQTQEMDSK